MQRQDSGVTLDPKVDILLSREDLQSEPLARLKTYASIRGIQVPDDATEEQILDIIFKDNINIKALPKDPSFRMPSLERNMLTSKVSKEDYKATIVQRKAHDRYFAPHKSMIAETSRAEGGANVAGPVSRHEELEVIEVSSGSPHSSNGSISKSQRSDVSSSNQNGIVVPKRKTVRPAGQIYNGPSNFPHSNVAGAATRRRSIPLRNPFLAKPVPSTSLARRRTEPDLGMLTTSGRALSSANTPTPQPAFLSSVTQPHLPSLFDSQLGGRTSSSQSPPPAVATMPSLLKPATSAGGLALREVMPTQFAQYAVSVHSRSPPMSEMPTSKRCTPSSFRPPHELSSGLVGHSGSSAKSRDSQHCSRRDAIVPNQDLLHFLGPLSITTRRSQCHNAAVPEQSSVIAMGEASLADRPEAPTPGRALNRRDASRAMSDGPDTFPIFDIGMQEAKDAGSASGCLESDQGAAAAASSSSSFFLDFSEGGERGEQQQQDNSQEGEVDDQAGEDDEENNGDDAYPAEGMEKKRYRPVLDQRPQFNMLFPEHQIPSDPITIHDFVPTDPLETYKYPPNGLRSRHWLEEHYDILKGERALLHNQIGFMEEHTHEALAEAALAKYEATQESRLLDCIFKRIAASAGSEFMDFLQQMVGEGEGDASQESEISVQEYEDDEDHSDDELEMPPSFGNAHFVEEEIPEELLTTMVPTLPVNGNNNQRQHSRPTSPEDGPPIPQARPVVPVTTIRANHKRSRAAVEDDADADDEAPFKRMRYRETVEDSDDDSSGDESAERFPQPANSPPSPVIAHAQPHSTEVPNAQALGAFDTDAVYNPNDSAGRKPSQFNPYYRENGYMYTPFYNDRVGKLQFGTLAESVPAAGPSSANRASYVAHPMGRHAGHGHTRSRGTALRDVPLPPHGGSRRNGRTATQDISAPDQRSYPGRKVNGSHRRDVYASPSDSFGPEDPTPNLHEYISQPRG